MQEKSCRFYDKVKFDCPSLIVGWKEDAGAIGSGVLEYLRDKLNAKLFAEIEPTGFFPLNGVTVNDNIAIFPECRFYYSSEKHVMLFEGHSPHTDWYRFLNTMIAVSMENCRLSEVYTVGGMISMAPHTTPRQVMAVSGSAEAKLNLQNCGLDTSMDYETPDGQRPTLSSYLVWLAARQKIKGASVWVPIPFYLTSVSDPEACELLLRFFDSRFGLGLDFTELEREIADRRQILDRARGDNAEMDEFLKRLESNLPLTQDENDKLIQDVEEVLGKNR
jgi:predicted ATP-grasp superfamily ATP-dependent carboligase